MCKIGANLKTKKLCKKKVGFSNLRSMTTSQNFTGTFPITSHRGSFFSMNIHFKEMKNIKITYNVTLMIKVQQGIKIYIYIYLYIYIYIFIYTYIFII